MENNYHLSNKKAIYYNLKVYYEAFGKDKWWHKIPLTFHIKDGLNDKEFIKFQQFFQGEEDMDYGDEIKSLGKTVWIVKPGENTNRGCGIQVCRDLALIKDMVRTAGQN